MEIAIKDLKKFYSNRTALNINQLVIKRGEIVGLVGNNGAGKTTLLQLILDLIKADEGAICINGEKVFQSESWKIYTSAYLDQSFLIDFLGAEEYFDFIGKSYNLDRQLIENQMKTFSSFMNNEILIKNKYIRDLSAGNKQKTGIIGAILPESKILMLDEPFNFIDPSSQYFLQNYIRSLNMDKDKIIMLTSHNIDQIANVATRVLLMEKGQIIKDIDTVDENSIHYLKNYFYRFSGSKQ